MVFFFDVLEPSYGSLWTSNLLREQGLQVLRLTALSLIASLIVRNAKRIIVPDGIDLASFDRFPCRGLNSFPSQNNAPIVIRIPLLTRETRVWPAFQQHCQIFFPDKSLKFSQWSNIRERSFPQANAYGDTESAIYLLWLRLFCGNRHFKATS